MTPRRLVLHADAVEEPVRLADSTLEPPCDNIGFWPWLKVDTGCPPRALERLQFNYLHLFWGAHWALLGGYSPGQEGDHGGD